MTRTWTKEQQCAIDAAGCSLLVSAAAGSGKTSVLTERIVSLLSRDTGVRASRLAVVTFTKAAAAELADRLTARLAECVAENPDNRRLMRQLTDLRSAQISTIHSFCYTLIRKYRKELNLVGSLRIADARESDALMKTAAEVTVRAFFQDTLDRGDSAGELLFSAIASPRQKDGLENALLELNHSFSSLPGKSLLARETLTYLKEETASLQDGTLSFGKSRFGARLFSAFQTRIKGAVTALNALVVALKDVPELEVIYAPVFEQCATSLQSAVENDAFSDPGTWEARLQTIFPRLPATRGLSEELREIKTSYQNYFRDQIKKPLLDFCRKNLDFSAPEAVREAQELLMFSEQILSLYDSFDALYTRLKRDKGILDYADLEQLTLQLFLKRENGAWQKTALCEIAAADFDAVFVDEYQDTNAVQDLIFRAVTRRDNLFIVGDPKQSIYRFRGAEPEIFTRYQLSAPRYPSQGDRMQKILLRDNFRCTPKIIDCVNLVFSVLMDETAPDSLYTKEDALRFPDALPRPDADLPCDIVLLTSPEGEVPEPEDDALRGEVRFIASRIGAILAGKEAGLEHTDPSDIAVLCRTNQQCEKIRRALIACGLPCRATPTAMDQDPEYLLVLSLLSVLDNPTRDIDLAAVLSSPLFSFDADDLVRVRAAAPKAPFFTALQNSAEASAREDVMEKSRHAIEVLSDLRRRMQRRTLPAVITELYHRFLIAELFQNDPARDAVRAYYLKSAKEAEEMDLSLSSFCRMLKDNPPAPDPSQGGGGVQVMTMHASKGLEFPVVFVSFLASPIVKPNAFPPLLYSADFGVVLPLARAGDHARIDPLWRKMTVLNEKEEMILEEKRLLYVAMTRARRKLILSGEVPFHSALERALLLFAEAPLPRDLIHALGNEAKNLLTLLLLSLRNHDGVREALCAGSTLKSDSFTLQTTPLLPVSHFVIKTEQDAQSVPFTFADFKESLGFTYQASGLENLPKKLSVSEILRHGREEEEPAYYPLRLMDFERGRLLASAAKIGTATHQVMQFIDFAAAKDNLSAECARLVAQGFISQEDMALVRIDEIRAFFDSPLYEKMHASKSVVHEKRFNVFLPAQDLLGKDGRVLVQGVVDAWFENPDGTLTLLDFKTDRVASDGDRILLDRHAEQLRLYQKAVEQITGKTVSALVLYSFALGRAIPVPME